IRFEAQFLNSAAIRSVSNVVAWQDTPGSFIRLFEPLADHVVEQFNEILADLPQTAASSHTAIDLISLILIATGNSFTRTRRIYQSLIFGGRVSLRFDPPAIRALARAGVLQARERGLHAVCNSYALALEDLREMAAMRLNPFQPRTVRC